MNVHWRVVVGQFSQHMLFTSFHLLVLTGHNYVHSDFGTMSRTTHWSLDFHQDIKLTCSLLQLIQAVLVHLSTQVKS